MHRRSPHFRLTIATAILGLSAISVHSTPLTVGQVALHGTSDAARPELAGTVIADAVQSYSMPGPDAGTRVFGTIESQVVREAGTGTLDFYWRVDVDPASTSWMAHINVFQLGHFGFANLTDADWRVDDTWVPPATTAELHDSVDRPDGALDFRFFNDGIVPGADGSHAFFVHTGATAFGRDASYSVVFGNDSDYQSNLFSTFSPSAVPEPQSWLLMALGLAAVAAGRRRRATR